MTYDYTLFKYSQHFLYSWIITLWSNKEYSINPGTVTSIEKKFKIILLSYDPLITINNKKLSQMKSNPFPFNKIPRAIPINDLASVLALCFFEPLLDIK